MLRVLFATQAKVLVAEPDNFFASLFWQLRYLDHHQVSHLISPERLLFLFVHPFA
jgi:hypothetical protein